MQQLVDQARRRITAWMEANKPRITQKTVAEAVGVSQSWVSQYKSGDQDADLDQLDAMARVFGHTLFELLDLRPSPKEQELIDAYRAVPVDRRPLVTQTAKAMIPPSREPRK